MREDFGTIESFEKTPSGIRMHFSKNGNRESAESTLAVVAIGWVANTSRLLPTGNSLIIYSVFLSVRSHDVSYRCLYLIAQSSLDVSEALFEI